MLLKRFEQRAVSNLLDSKQHEQVDDSSFIPPISSQILVKQRIEIAQT